MFDENEESTGVLVICAACQVVHELTVEEVDDNSEFSDGFWLCPECMI